MWRCLIEINAIECVCVGWTLCVCWSSPHQWQQEIQWDEFVGVADKSWFPRELHSAHVSGLSAKLVMNRLYVPTSVTSRYIETPEAAPVTCSGKHASAREIESWNNVIHQVTFSSFHHCFFFFYSFCSSKAVGCNTRIKLCRHSASTGTFCVY